MSGLTRLTDVKDGDVLVTDDGRFECMREGARLIVGTNTSGDLYVPCAAGQHILRMDRRICVDGVLHGLTKVPEAERPIHVLDHAAVEVVREIARERKGTFMVGPVDVWDTILRMAEHPEIAS